MTDPVVSPSATGLVVALPVIATAGSIFGFEWLCILFALMGGGMYLLFMDKMTWVGCSISIFVSTLVGTLVAQWLGSIIITAAILAVAYFVPQIDLMSVASAIAVPIKATLAFFTGLFAQRVLPAAFERTTKWGRGVGDSK
jgi:hypothetical protein